MAMAQLQYVNLFILFVKLIPLQDKDLCLMFV